MEHIQSKERFLKQLSCKIRHLQAGWSSWASCAPSAFLCSRVYCRQIMPWHNNVHILVFVLCASQYCSHVVLTQTFKTTVIISSLLQRVCICSFHCRLGFPVLFDNVDKLIRFRGAYPSQINVGGSVFTKSPSDRNNKGDRDKWTWRGWIIWLCLSLELIF